MPFRLQPTDDLPGGVGRIAREELASARDALLEGCGKRDDDIHSARKSMKRMRGLIRLVRRDLGDITYTAENATYRDAAGQLAGLRDATVLVGTLETVGAELADEGDRLVAAGVRERLEDRRQSAYQAVGADDREQVIADVADVLSAACDRVDEWRLDGADWKTIADGAGRMYRRGRSECDDCRRQPTTHQLHQWRKRVKYLYYQSQILQPLWPTMMQAWQAELDELGGLLGDDHDLAVLAQTLTEPEVAADDDTEPLQLAIGRRRQRLQQQALDLGARAYVERPADFLRRWRGLWRIWQQERDGAQSPVRPLMSLTPPARIADRLCHTGEGPLWHPDEGCLYWIDIPAGHLFRYTPDDGRHEQVLDAGCAIGGFTVQADGALLLFLARGAIAIWRDGAPLQMVVDEIPVEVESRFNDVIADPRGRVFCGTMPNRGEGGRLYRLDTDGSLTELLDGIGCSNGMGFSPDRRQMYFIDSPTRKISKFAYDEAAGELSHRRVFVDLQDEAGAPDGMTVDLEGGVWCALWGGSCLVRFRPDGSEDQRIEFPALKVSSAGFGGSEYDELYVTTAGGHQRETDGDGAGALFRVRPAVGGPPEFRSRVGL